MPIIDLTDDRVPPGQQLVARAKWPIIGEREPAEDSRPWRLQLAGAIQNPLTLTLDELQSLPQTSLHMDIHCVTRWSRQKMTFTGVLLADLIAQVVPKSEAKFVSFISRSTRRHSTSLAIQVARELQTLIAYEFDGQSLPTDHGGPIRNIVPGRYFYKSVKWLETIEFLHVDRLGYWEAQSGYHNNADYLREERYMAPTLDKQTALKLIESRDFSEVDLRSIDASERDLSELNAKNALLRDANFRKSNLSRANFTDANMSNAHLEDSDLRGAQFKRTDLEGANLSGADLRAAVLEDCSLIGASFHETLSDGTISAAQIDDTTTISDASLHALTAVQREFVQSRLGR